MLSTEVQDLVDKRRNQHTILLIIGFRKGISVIYAYKGRMELDSMSLWKESWNSICKICEIQQQPNVGMELSSNSVQFIRNLAT